MDVTRQITDGFAVVAECLAPTGIFPDFRHVPRQYIARIDKNVMCPHSVRINLRIIRRGAVNSYATRLSILAASPLCFLH